MHMNFFDILLIVVGFIGYGEWKARKADKSGYQRGSFFTMKEAQKQLTGLVPGRIPDGYSLIHSNDLLRLTTSRR